MVLAAAATVPPPELTAVLTTQGKIEVVFKIEKREKEYNGHQMLNQFWLDQNPIKCSSYNIFIANWFDC